MTKRKVKGFTLIELVIVIVIIGILSAISVPLYKNYTRKAMAAEGKALVGAVSSAEKAYLIEKATYLGVASTGYNSTLDIDARGNKYFTTYSVTAGGNTAFTIQTIATGADAAGITVQLIQPSATTGATITEYGL
jgi:prepilin-type N-terminal cleavage/methylation domain-containing protein